MTYRLGQTADRSCADLLCLHWHCCTSVAEGLGETYIFLPVAQLEKLHVHWVLPGGFDC